jgi:hypothetical protein
MTPTLEPLQSRADLGEAGHHALPWLTDESDRRSVQIGILGTVLIHIVLLFLAPKFINLADVSHPPAPRARPKEKNLEIPLEMFLPPKPAQKQLPRFVETNPNAPENIPDKTNNISDRNQQVAQEKPTPNGKSDMPAQEGKKDFQSTQIVDGRLSQPDRTPPVPQQVTAAPKPPSPAAPRLAQTPVSGFDKQQGSDAAGYASSLAKPTDNPTNVPKAVDGAKNAPPNEMGSAFSPQIDPKHPQPRKNLEQHVRPAIFAENKIGTQNIGMAAWDARWSNYGVYLQRLIESVQIQWERILNQSAVSPNSGSTVEVKFTLNSRGEISKIIHVTPSAGTSDAATQACPSAITSRAPYGEWTDDMIAMLGNEQEFTFVFYYQ